MSTETKSLGFIGLGMMGYPMASHLHAAGYPLTVFDIAKVQSAQFQAEHAGTVVTRFCDVHASSLLSRGRRSNQAARRAVGKRQRCGLGSTRRAVARSSSMCRG